MSTVQVQIPQSEASDPPAERCGGFLRARIGGMYIVTDEVDYESTTITSAHGNEADAIKSAEALVGTYMDAWDVPKARQALNDTWSLGPATEAVAVWRCYDRSTIAVYRLKVADAPADPQPPDDGRRREDPAAR